MFGGENGVNVNMKKKLTILLMTAISVLSLMSCAGSGRNVKSDEMNLEPRIEVFNNQEYWCLEKDTMGMLLKEAGRK